MSTAPNTHVEPEKEATPTHKRPNAWALRAYLSTIGQSLLLYSGLKTAGTSSDRHALIGFAGVNLVANAINAIFGGQKKEDKHQLRFLKKQINDELEPLAGEALLPAVDAKLDHNTNKKAGESQTHYLLQKYSVTISEFILRTVGSLSLIAPVTGWGKAARNLRSGMSIAETFSLARTKNPVTFGAGLFSLSGKGFILAASEPNPYSPEPMTLWRTLREKVMFKMSSVVEVICAVWMGHDRFTKQKININGTLHPDYVGTVGNSSIILGYIPRWIAPYGTREVNMTELYAHAAKALSAIPQEKATSMVEQISVELAEHFKDKNIEASTIKQQIAQRMEKTPATHIQAKGATHEKETAEVARSL